MSKHAITLGADPEFFVTKIGSDKFIPACGLFGGEKGHPVILSDDGGYLEDGCAVEFNVKPADNIHTLASRVRGLKSLFSKKFPGFEVYNHAHASFIKGELKKHPQANVIGCGGDLAAWGVRMPPDIQMFGDNRFAGGHIHIGINPWPDNLSKGDLIRFLDLWALLPNIKEQNQKRMKFYGSPGLYRETSYGVEWRSPDSHWVGGNCGFIKSFDTAILALKAILANTTPLDIAYEVRGVVERYDILDTLQSVPFVQNNDSVSWMSVKASFEDRIMLKMEDTPEAFAFHESRKKLRIPQNRVYKVDPLHMMMDDITEPVGGM